MKAKEYYAKYKDRIASKDDKESLQGVCDMLSEFCMEAKELVAKRKVRSDCGGVAVLRKLNAKYNAVCMMFERDYGAPIIKKDGFMSYWRKQIPELDLRLSRKEAGNDVAGSV